jgi:hypothetical protein
MKKLPFCVYVLQSQALKRMLRDALGTPESFVQ